MIVALPAVVLEFTVMVGVPVVPLKLAVAILLFDVPILSVPPWLAVTLRALLELGYVSAKFAVELSVILPFALFTTTVIVADLVEPLLLSVACTVSAYPLVFAGVLAFTVIVVPDMLK